MKLHAITITASSDDTPFKILSYKWAYGDPLPDLKQCLTALTDYIASIETPAGKAASATTPILHD
jgi:hypothetical protein